MFSIFNKKPFYHYDFEDTMTKIIATLICNINEIFIGIFRGMPLGYII